MAGEKVLRASPASLPHAFSRGLSTSHSAMSGARPGQACCRQNDCAHGEFHRFPRTSKPSKCHRSLIENALADSAEYADSHMQRALYFRSREDLWDFALSKIEVDGAVAEFGVFKGNSINYFARKLQGRASIYGFDSFEGLQEDCQDQGCGFLGRTPE